MKIKRLILDTIERNGYYVQNKYFVPIGVKLRYDLDYRYQQQINTIFDVGANVGQTLQWTKEFWPKSTVHCFEPFKEPFEQLKNFAVKNYGDDVVLNNTALSDHSESIQLNPSPYSQLNSIDFNSKDPSKPLDEIKVIRGDDYMQQNKITTIDLLKIDTEGHEMKVLQGFESALMKNNIKIIFTEAGFGLSDSGHTFHRKIDDFLLSKNFKLAGIYDFNNQFIADDKHYANLLYINDTVLK